MRLSVLIIAVSLIFSTFLSAQKLPLLHLKYEENYTPAYDEVIDMYRLLDKHYSNAQLVEIGKTDVGKPLHLFIINNKEEFDPVNIRKEGKSIFLINNGIHPGEPEGIDASLWYADDILRNKNGMAEILKNTAIIIIPVYSIGGHLNRSVYNRSGQTTPYETGFRGNAKNLDLNRDFTKCDSENAKSFARMFRNWNPDVFLDTHTTNGSDHQYSITLIPPASSLFPPAMENFIRKRFIPEIYNRMENGQYELIPYVNYIYDDPKKGIASSVEGPRYSSGYASMFHSYGMMTENQIYKAFPDRVKSCYQFISALAEFTSENSREIMDSRKEGLQQTLKTKKFPVTFFLDTTTFQIIEFKGYEADPKQVSPVTGVERFGYDLSKPYTEKIKYFDTWKPEEFVEVPEFYIIPQAYSNVIERLENAGVHFSKLKNDTVLKVTVDYINEFTSPPRPYNGHYFHDKISTHSEVREIKYYRGDVLVPVQQESKRYIFEMLEPKAGDSFFRWNFFDNILDQREYFSSYGFDENALKYLNEHPGFNKIFKEKQQSDPEFAKNHRAQLAYIYNNSEWLEKTWKRYPVGKIF